MSKDLIRYDILAQEALRGLVRRVLQDTVRAGLPGEHHFFITFESTAPGVRLSQRLREEHPEEMTIVIQHQYWDLKVSDSHFEVSLSFNGVAEHLRVPFAAIKGFFDPSVSFGLQFDPQMIAEAQSADGEVTEIATTLPDIGIEPKGQAKDKAKNKAKAGGNTEGGAADHHAAGDAAKTEDDGEDDSPANSDGADVVSLDSFRKKS